LRCFVVTEIQGMFHRVLFACRILSHELINYKTYEMDTRNRKDMVT